MTIDALLQKFELFGIRLGLDRSRHLLATLGNPQKQVPIIHVAGSNGKGSVCAYLSAVLTAAGYQVGRYTSPHLISWCERICINEQPIAPEALEQVLEQIIAAIPADADPPTQFEVITAAAWLHFAQQQVDIAVVEVGLGGRLDSTNVCDRPLASVIVSISREHWQRLGPTLADIAGEKAGILKPNCPAIIGQLPAEAMTVVKRRIAELGCPAIYPEPATLLPPTPPSPPSPLPLVTYQSITYPLPLQGEIQRHNSALAIATLQLLRQQGWSISDSHIATGMANTRWPGRLQWFTWRDRPILIDGAHNPDSAKVLRRFVDSLTRTPIHWVMGIMANKDHADMFQELLRVGDRLYLLPVPDPSSADPLTLAELAPKICPELASCQTFGDVVTALDAAIGASQTSSLPDKPLVVLTGSLYLIGHFLEVEHRKSVDP